jgi:Uma2 family endonuclease
MTAAPVSASPFRLPDSEGFTVADLHALPEDGLRYELIDGSLIVSPSATSGHNIIARWIATALEDACPNDDYLVSTDQSASMDDHNEPRPDVVVARVEHYERSPFPIEDALLVVEVVSPTSVLRDTETKRGLYARAGVPSYWIVVPERDKPSISLAELALDGETRSYRYVTHYTSEVFETDVPWRVRIDLPAMIARRAKALGRGSD